MATPGGNGDEDFPLWPYLDTLYRWVEDQPDAQTELIDAWSTFVRGVPHAPRAMPDVEDADQHDRVLRFWSWFCLDRPLADGVTPLGRFLVAHRADLTGKGRALYESLTRTVYGMFKVHVQFRLALLEDLATNTRYRLVAGGLAEELQSGDLVVGRLYAHGEGYVGDPDVHIGHPMEAPGDYRVTPPTAEARFYAAQVPAKGAVMDVLDALLLQVDSPLTADDVYEMVRGGGAMEAVLDGLYAAPIYRLRYLHMRDRSLFDELLQELWDTSGPLQDAELQPADATALARTVREGLRAIADGDLAALLALADPKGYLPIYLDLFGIKGMQRLTDVANSPPDTTIRTKHQLLPKDGGIFTTLSWGKEGSRHSAGMVAYATPEGHWHLADLSPPENASQALMIAFDRTQNLGWGDMEAADPVEALLRKAVMDVGYAVHDTIDLFRLWRDFKAAAAPDLSQPAIWAAGVELADTRYRNEDLELKVLAKSYGVMPRAIEEAATAIDETLQALHAAEEVH